MVTGKYSKLLSSGMTVKISNYDFNDIEKNRSFASFVYSVLSN